MGISYTRLAPPALLESLGVLAPSHSQIRALTPALEETALPQKAFHAMLTLERQRAERSRKPFVLMLIDAHLENGAAAGILSRAADVIQLTKRETDVFGWYSEAAILGVIFTETKIDENHPVTKTLRSKIERAVRTHLGPADAAKIFLSLKIFPETLEQDDSSRAEGAASYPDIHSAA
jgi:hypothetical protein